jgi:hypothetical protein
MIDTIHLAGVGTYGPEAQLLYDLKQVNYVYGANGSGKATISRVVADPSHADHARCDLVWKGGRPLEALVYKRDFVAENFGGEEIKSVLTVGKRSVAAWAEIARLKAQARAAEFVIKNAQRRETLRGSDPEVEGGELAELSSLAEQLEAKWHSKIHLQ